tara:strand:+ start:27 stop:239 length:213 start_codon:yes stop_codon:yes gene_type:complete
MLIKKGVEMTKKQIVNFIEKNIEKWDNTYEIDFQPLNRGLIVQRETKKQLLDYLMSNIDYLVKYINYGRK